MPAVDGRQRIFLFRKKRRFVKNSRHAGRHMRSDMLVERLLDLPFFPVVIKGRDELKNDRFIPQDAGNL